PPAANRFYRELGGVVIHSHAHPAIVPAEVINPVRGRASQFGIDKIMDSNLLRLPLRTHLTPAILEVADHLLLLGVHRNHGVVAAQTPLYLPVQMLKLSVAVGVVGALLRLPVGLQTVAQFMQQIGHNLMADLMLHSFQFRGQLTHALAGPTERRLRIPARGGFQERLQIGLQRRILVAGSFASTALFADTSRYQRCGILQFSDALANYRPRDPDSFRNNRDAAFARGLALRSC